MNDKLVPDEKSVEALLGRYRPVGPPPGLHGRVVASLDARLGRGPVLWWASMAAMIAISICLITASQATARQTAAMIDGHHWQWTPQMEEAVAWFEQQHISRDYFVWLWRLEQMRTPADSHNNFTLTSGGNSL